MRGKGNENKQLLENNKRELLVELLMTGAYFNFIYMICR